MSGYKGFLFLQAIILCGPFLYPFGIFIIYKQKQMAKKKVYAKKAAAEKTVMIKIAEKVGELAARAVNEKEHLVEMAGNAIKSVKATIQNATSEKKFAEKKGLAPVRKKAVKKIASPAAKKAAKTTKKTMPEKKVPKKNSTKKR
jgi:hypothetical protein